MVFVTTISCRLDYNEHCHRPRRHTFAYRFTNSDKPDEQPLTPVGRPGWSKPVLLISELTPSSATADCLSSSSLVPKGTSETHPQKFPHSCPKRDMSASPLPYNLHTTTSKLLLNLCQVKFNNIIQLLCTKYRCSHKGTSGRCLIVVLQRYLFVPCHGVSTMHCPNGLL